MGELAFISGLVLVVLLAFVGTLLISATPTHAATVKFQTRLFLAALAVRFAATLALYAAGAINVLKDEDASGWLVGAAYYQGWERAGLSILDAPGLFIESYSEHHKGYYYLLGIYFMITSSPGRLPAAALNCFFGALTVIFTYRLARSLFSNQVAERAGWLACFFPSLIIWSAQTLKEPVVIFLGTMALYGCIRLNCFGYSLRHVILVGLAGVLLFPFRFYAAYLVFGTACVSLLLPRMGSGQARLPSLLGVGVIVLGFAGFSGFAVQKEAQLEKYDLKYLQHFREYANVGQGSGVKIDADIETPGGFGLVLVIGAVHLLMAPFPWQWLGGSIRMLLVIPEILSWWWLLFFGVIPGMRYAVRKRFFDVLPMLILIVGMGLLYSAMFSNVGLVYRQRAQLLPWLLVFASLGLELRKIHQTQFQKVPSPVGEAAGVVPRPGMLAGSAGTCPTT